MSSTESQTSPATHRRLAAVNDVIIANLNWRRDFFRQHPVIIASFFLQALIFAYFVVSTELLIAKNNHSVSDEEWGFGQVRAFHSVSFHKDSHFYLTF